MSKDIAKACRKGSISCRRNFLPYMLRLNNDEISRIPMSLRSSIQELSFHAPPRIRAQSSLGSDDQLRKTSNFLNVTNYTSGSTKSLDADSAIAGFSLLVRASIVSLYSRFLPIVLLTGAFSGVFLLIRALLTRSYSLGLIFATAAWMLVVCRITALVLIDISQFPAITHEYLSYAFQFATVGSLIYLLLLYRWGRMALSAKQKSRAQREVSGKAKPAGALP
ncbi:MAG: hypothetical protein M3Y72_07200 [Acidobacteriota bacterium]|nr:hypothetical protein [Acidobacteriota bacterium]